MKHGSVADNVLVRRTGSEERPCIISFGEAIFHTCSIKMKVAQKVWCTAHNMRGVSDPLPCDELIGLALGPAHLWIPGEHYSWSLLYS